jgi:thiol-disulfide isomerase/thioredoxin/sugar lactone lactonase YvrE
MSRVVTAPELDGGLAWFNVARPFTMRELRGRVVVLDFWTYCCVNCMHVQPVLRTLEEKYAAEPLVVIGVHSGKFSAEHDPARIRDAIGRYEVRHPVVVDRSMSIWGRYGIRSWPTIVVVRPDGTIAAVAPGEPKLEVLDAFVAREIDLARKAGTLAEGPLILPAPPRAFGRGTLSYPGKVSVLPGGRLAISDSGHHRVLITSGDGEVLLAIGCGLRGLVDGAVADACFDDPQGTCWHDGALYVADTRNHAIRRVDLDRGLVTTVAGTGALAAGALAGRAVARGTALRSPWDLASGGDVIYAALAGSHQIARFAPDRGEIEAYAGTGVEAMLDGRVDQSAFAQPSGLSLRDGTLYVADSETSSVRAVDLTRGLVRTLVGEGLFDFGDADGDASEALLQHGLGVAAVPGGVLVADTYNGKIRHVAEDAAGVRVSTVLAGLSEPGSIAVAPSGGWIVADTNAHRVLRVDGGHVTSLEVRGAPVPMEGVAGAPVSRPRRDSMPSLSEVSTLSLRGWFTALLELPEAAGLAPGDGVIALELEAAPGTELSAGAPLRVAVEVSRRSDLLLLLKDRFSLDAAGGPKQVVPLEVTVTELPDPVIEAELVVTVSYVVCHAGEAAACTSGKVHARVPVRLLAAGGTGSLTLSVPLAPLSG